MLQDPWVSLMKQHQQAAPVEQPSEPVEDTGILGSTAAHSMSDMFDAVEQVKALTEEFVCKLYILFCVKWCVEAVYHPLSCCHVTYLSKLYHANSSCIASIVGAR